MAKENEEKEFTPPDTGNTVNPPEGYTAEDWEGLSDDEREGILDSIANPEIADVDEAEDVEEGTLKEIAGEDGDKGGDDEDKTTTPAPVDGLEADNPPPPAAGDKTTVKTDEELLSFKATVLDSEIPAEALEPSKELKETRDKALSDLRNKWETGEIDDEAYQDQRDEIRDDYTRKSILATQGRRDEIVKEIGWQKEQRAFYDAHPEYLGVKKADGIWEKTLRSSGLWGALNEAVTNLETTRPGLTGISLLVEAHRIVAKEFGLAASSQPAAATKKGGKPPVEVPDLTSLGDVPGAGSNNPQDAWAVLDRLTGEAYERALERLTPAQRDAYLSQV